MSDDDSAAEDLGPAERRLFEHLELLRAAPPAAAPEMIERIIRRARWQRVIRDPLLLIGSVAAAIGDGLLLLVGPPEAH
jgi:hypothetical protein